MPTALPNEHLLSVLCRGVHLGISNHWQELLSKRELDRAEFSPGHILRPIYASIAVQYRGISNQELLIDHTLWRYFRSFMPDPLQNPPDIEQWALRYNYDRTLVPVKSIRYRHAKQWRWCPACNREDYDNFGVCYWHVEHQIPGLTHCIKHPKTMLRGACDPCGSQITDISDRSIHLYADSRCPKCAKHHEESKSFPFHPVLEWISSVSTRLFEGAVFNMDQARKDIFHEVGIDPSVKPTAAHRKRVSVAKKMIDSALPVEVINWLFQTRNRGSYQTGEPVTPLDLKQLYDSNAVVHPVSWLTLVWILLSDHKNLESYIS